MDGFFLRKAAAERPQLFQAIAAFNMRYARLQPMPGPFAGLGGAGALLWKDADIRRRFAVPEFRGWWDFSHEPSRLALPDPQVLLRTCRYFSGAVFSEEISRVVLRGPLLDLRGQLGPDLYSYAVRRGRYQSGSMSRTFLPLAGDGPLGVRIERLAGSALSLITSSWPEGLQQFLRQHEPEIFSIPGGGSGSASSGPAPFAAGRDDKPSRALGRAEKRTLWLALKKILLKEVAPEWAPCFD